MKRRTNRPSKQLMYFWVIDVLDKTSKFDSGLDVACGEMHMRRFFRTKNYIGIDADEERIRKGGMKYPEVVCSAKTIEAMDSGDRGDFVLCMETIGINNNFDERNTIQCVEKLVLATNSGGMLVFNVGPMASDYFYEVDLILRRSFNNMVVKRYGRFSGLTHHLLSYFLARFMKIVPFIARSSSTPYRLYICDARTPDPTG